MTVARCIAVPEIDAIGSQTGLPTFSEALLTLPTSDTFFPERFPATFRYEGSRVNDDAEFEIVRVWPDREEAIEIWVDRKTHLVSRLVHSPDRVSTKFFDYRDVGGVVVPFGFIDSDVTIATDTLVFEPAGSVSFSPPAR